MQKRTHNPNALSDAHEAVVKVTNQLSRGLITKDEADTEFLYILIELKNATLHAAWRGYVHPSPHHDPEYAYQYVYNS